MHPEYQRLSPDKGGRSLVVNMKGKEFVVDNRWIVPYSPYLSLRYNCHINIELCISPTAAKYLYKYIYKGEDRAMVKTQVENVVVRDEIEEYEDLRSVGSSEAVWHLLNFTISKKHPAVYSLRCHLEDEQQVVFDEGEAENVIEKARKTELTEFFEYNSKVPSTDLMYVDFPKKFVWYGMTWKKRKAAMDTIGRVHAMHPLAGDVFYLRMLLHNDHCKGKKSFSEMRNVGGIARESYQEVCRVLGLLQDDREWDEVLRDGAITQMCSALRELFVTILLFCMPANPKELFEGHHLDWADDFIRDAKLKGIELNQQQLKTLTLLDIQRRLKSWDKDLKAFGLKEPSHAELIQVNLTEAETLPVLIKEELDFDITKLSRMSMERIAQFTDSQSLVFNEIMDAVVNEYPLYQFIDARGGTGKTFVLNAVLASVRSIASDIGGSIGLAVATTGVASTLLHLGRTFHSRFKAPLSPEKDSFCSIDCQSTLAELIRLSKIIVIDEAPMLHRYLFEALDRTLKDIVGSEKPFGGKIVICSGDFRQTLTVIPHAGRASIVDASLNRSHLWKHFVVRHLTENMRLKLNQDPKLKDFDDWTLKIGDGCLSTEHDGDEIIMRIPADMCIQLVKNSPEDPQSETKCMKKLADHVYPNLNDNYKTCGWMNGRAILAPTNKQVLIDGY